jgi:hypothetical protein
LFEDASKIVSAEWHARLKAGHECRRWIQNVGYGLLARTIENGFANVFDERIRRVGRRSPSLEVNPFKRGLLALFAHDKGAMDDRERDYFGKRLWYAYRHYVPQPFLLGFLAEVWNDKRMRQAPRDQIEAGFEDWVILERANDERSETRGAYPAEIDAKVAQARTLLLALRASNVR